MDETTAHNNTPKLTEPWMFTDKQHQDGVVPPPGYEVVEIFDYLDDDNNKWSWDVNRARRILRSSPPRTVFAAPWENIKELYESKTTYFDIDIIVVPYPQDYNKSVLIDGSHRVYKAYVTKSYLLCVFLTADESNRCMVDKPHLP